jgi:hypothetical protein
MFTKLNSSMGYRHPVFMCQLGSMEYTGKLYKMKDYDYNTNSNNERN